MEAHEMYREHILDLYKHPHNFGTLKAATNTHREFNPLCGDDVTMDVIVEDGKIRDIKFHGKGCAISMAAASLVTDAVKGKPIAEVKRMSKEDLLNLLHIPVGPVRLKCALLALDTLHKSIGDAK
ncbi:SUF system NifU family Fe-S cluster assembly protein [Candidatus Woesearchaeota archaeon]|nr:SUF system NifU family Fe-S cluster assembly protein [Candidatus Woesearchaeota archaeon]